jgi:hypothetical protein
VRINVHESTVGGNDRDTTNDDRDTAAPAMTTPTLSTALDHPRLDGAISYEASTPRPWAYESPTGEMMASLLLD